MMAEQKRFFRVEASSIISYHPEKCPEMISSLSIQEVLQIVRNDAIKQQASDIVAIPQDKQIHLKEALDIRYDSLSNSANLLKVSARWDDADQARQLVEGYIQTAIAAYVRFRNNYLREIITEQNKMKSEYEHEQTTIEGTLSKLAQSVHAESVKQALETLRMHENRLEDELSDLKKQYMMTTIQYENLKPSIPNKNDYINLKTAFQHPYILDILKKRDEALDNYEIQKALGGENDRQVKEAQLKYRLAGDRLSKTLENLNLTEEEVSIFNTDILKNMKELESIQLTMDGVKKYIENVQYRLDQKQKEISAIADLLPQEEKLKERHKTTLAKLNKLEIEITELNRLEMAIPKSLLPLNFINVHRVNIFSFSNCVQYLLAGIVIIAISSSIIIFANTHGKRHVHSPPTTTKH